MSARPATSRWGLASECLARSLGRAKVEVNSSGVERTAHSEAFMSLGKVSQFWKIGGGLTLLILLLVANMHSLWAKDIGGFVVPGSRAADLQNCVEPTRVMRRYHMEYIRHQRDTTVYDGIRHTKYSLSGCVDCHAAHDASGTPMAVNGKQQFCSACHEMAAVTLNCFDCHATVPDGESWNQITERGAPGHPVAGIPSGILPGQARLPIAPQGLMPGPARAED